MLFTLVAVRGSSYRRAGARLLVVEGRSAGTVSGGCLEAELLRRSGWYVRDGARIEEFSTAFDDTAEVPYGLGCGGEVEMLAEQMGTSEADALIRALRGSIEGKASVVATVLPAPPTSLLRFVVDARGDVLFASDALPTEDIVELRKIALRSSHGALHSTSLGRMFIERLDPVQRLVIFGAGEDARPLCRLAIEMGWHVTVVDTRSQRFADGRFTGAEVTVAERAADVSLYRADAVVVMTHSYEQDRRLVAEMLPAPPHFLGLLGARHRSALLLAEAAELAGVSLEAAVRAVHAPVGLELGGEGPEAIALAIISEIQSSLAADAPSVASRRMSFDDVERVLQDTPALLAASTTCALYLAAEPRADATVAG